MVLSRRRFLDLLSGVACVSARRQLAGLSKITSFESRCDQEGSLIRLNSNENAYGPSARVVDAIRSSLESTNRYPHMRYESLLERIANFHKVKVEQVVLGCGSTEILRMAALAFGGAGKQLIQASPTFEAIEYYGRAAGSEVVSVGLTPAFAHDLHAMLARVSASSTLVYICNPNNPTGSLTPRRDLESFISKLPTSTNVLIDEAYHHYAGQSGMYASFIDRPLCDDRVIVSRTFSKVYGLAGLRLGYAVASPNAIQHMRRFATKDNINTIVALAALVALDDVHAVDESVRRNANNRQEFFNQSMIRSLKPIDSHANFVMMNTFHPAEDVAVDLRNKGIVIGCPFPPMNTHIRVSLGRPDEMGAFWKAWDELPYTKTFMPH